MALRHQLLAMFQTYLNKKEPFRPGVIISENFRDPLDVVWNMSFTSHMSHAVTCTIAVTS